MQQNAQQHNNRFSWENKTAVLLLAGMIVFITIGCGKKADPPAITDLIEYQDKSLNFAIKAPANWKASTKPGELAAYYSSEQIAQRFVDYKDAEVSGALVSITGVKTEQPANFDSVLNASKIFTDETAYKPIENVTIAGMSGKKLSYEVDYSDGKFKGETYIAAKDSTAYTVIKFEAFGGVFDALKPKFDEMLASVQLAYAKPVVRDTAAKQAEPFKASTTLSAYAGATNFAISVPDNFSGSKKAGGIEAVEFKGIGGPLDCIIRVDVTDASKQGNLDKIIAQNKAKYNGEPVATTVDGEKAYLIEDNAGKDIRRRTYFTLKNSKLYRITITWFKPEQEFFLPMFEKSFASFKFK
jgi:hypothetical protein